MKKIAIISAIALSGLFFNTANAQISIHLGLNLGNSRPVAHIAANFSNANNYYYLPDVDAYYSVAEESYYYNNGNSWISAAYLPGAYRNYDWRNARRYEVHASRPYLNNSVYREKYHGNTTNWNRNIARPQSDNNWNKRPEVRPDNRRGAEHAQPSRQNDNRQRGNERFTDKQPWKWPW